MKNNSFIIQSNMNEIFLNKNYTDLIKGLAMLFIVIWHIIQILVPSSILYYEQILSFICKINIIGVGCFFFLSGYGNYLSICKINNLKEQLFKCFSKIKRIYIVFFIALITYILMYMLLHNGASLIDWNNFWFYFSTLTIPGYTIWYLKVQIIAYLIMLISLFARKHVLFICFMGVIIYILLSIYMHISALWWQTILCFPLGCYVGKYRNEIIQYLNTNHTNNIKVGTTLIIITLTILCFCSGIISRMFLAVLGTITVLLIPLVYNKHCEKELFIFLGKQSVYLYIYHWIYIAVIRYLPISILFKILFVMLGVGTLLLLLYKKEKNNE